MYNLKHYSVNVDKLYESFVKYCYHNKYSYPRLCYNISINRVITVYVTIFLVTQLPQFMLVLMDRFNHCRILFLIILVFFSSHPDNVDPQLYYTTADEYDVLGKIRDVDLV